MLSTAETFAFTFSINITSSIITFQTPVWIGTLLFTTMNSYYNGLSRINSWKIIVFNNIDSNKYVVFNINGTTIWNWGLLTCAGLLSGYYVNWWFYSSDNILYVVLFKSATPYLYYIFSSTFNTITNWLTVISSMLLPSTNSDISPMIMYNNTNIL